MYSETYQVTVADLGYYEKEKQIEILVNDHGDRAFLFFLTLRIMLICNYR